MLLKRPYIPTRGLVLIRSRPQGGCAGRADSSTRYSCFTGVLYLLCCYFAGTLLLQKYKYRPPMRPHALTHTRQVQGRHGCDIRHGGEHSRSLTSTRTGEGLHRRPLHCMKKKLEKNGWGKGLEKSQVQKSAASVCLLK